MPLLQDMKLTVHRNGLQMLREYLLLIRDIGFNKAFGEFGDLPFDLRTRRLLAYDMPENAAERAPERKRLMDQLEGAVRVALTAVPTQTESTLPIAAVDAIENGRGNKIITLRRDLSDILKELISTQPTKHSSGGTVEDLIDAIGKTQEAVARFSKISEVIAIMGDNASALDTYRWFGQLFVLYELAGNFTTGSVSDGDYDFFRFVGHEMFVTFIAFMIREQKWEILTQVLDEPIPVSFLRYPSGSHGNVTWEYASKYLPLLASENGKRGRTSIRADILKERHTTGGLAAILPFEDFMAADLFLFLRGELPPASPGPHFEWNPWSCLYLTRIPLFIMRTVNRTIAGQVGRALGVSDPDQFKQRLQERISHLERRYSELSISFNPQDFNFIGTQGLAQIILPSEF